MAGFQSVGLRREFLGSLAISLALHAMILGGFRGYSLPESKVEAIEARLRTVPIPEAPPVPAVRSGPKAPPVASGAPRETSAAPETVAAVADAVPAPPQAAPAAPALSVEPPRAVPEGRIDADGLRAYRIGLASAARGLKQYPERARRAGWAGTAEVRISIAANGLATASLARSSGHEALDAAAVEMLKGAAGRTPLPEALLGREFAVVLPVVFGLEE